MEAVESGTQEASFNEYRIRNRDDILVAHQVPLSKIGGGDSAAIAAALAQDRTFKEQVARPAQRDLEKLINKIIREKTDILESQILERYVRNQIMVPNEARNVLGLPQIEGGDEPLELNPRQAADAESNARQTRARDSERSNNSSDNAATIAGRNPQGEGRATT
jgi:hypothetical protein